MKKVSARKVIRRGKPVWRVLLPRRGGARYFDSASDARLFASQVNDSAIGPSAQLLSLPAETQDAILRALRAVDGDGAALETAALDYAARVNPANGMTIGDLVERCLAAKEAAGLRRRSLSSLGSSLRLFARGREHESISRITPAAVAQWLENPGWLPRTREGHLVNLRTLCAWAIGMGIMRSNPAAGVQKPVGDSRPPGILTVRQCARLMVACRREDPGLLPYVALCLFGGLRPEREARGAQWEDIRGGYVHIPSDRAKGRERRLVPINPTMRAWLDFGGDLPPRNLAKRLKRVRARARIPWPHDCLRHSYVSYALPLHGAALVAQWSGHTEDVLYRHYRELVTREDADRFWRLVPRARS